MSKPYKELTPEELIDVVLRFHPKMDPHKYPVYQDFNDAYWKSPERRALSMAQEQAWDQSEAFTAFVAAVREALPPGSYAKDHTVPGHDGAYLGVFAPARQPESAKEPPLVVHVGFLIPYYTYYGADKRPLAGPPVKSVPRLYEIRTELKPIAELVEREIARRFGYIRFPAELATLRLSGVYIPAAPDEPTLFDALFSPHRW